MDNNWEGVSERAKEIAREITDMECHEFVIFTYKNLDIPFNEDKANEFLAREGIDLEENPEDVDYMSQAYERKHEQCKSDLDSEIGEFADLDNVKEMVCHEFYKGVREAENMFDIEFGHRIDGEFVGHVGEFLGMRETAEFAWGIFEEFECFDYVDYDFDDYEEDDDDDYDEDDYDNCEHWDYSDVTNPVCLKWDD
jgi:hypothetical protein